MARKMRKFSDGGALGKYTRRMADIEKDFKKDSAGKSGKALEVLEAKRAQRTADAEDDRAKRTGADRTATRAAERAAESNLTKTRKYGAPQSVTKDTAGPTGKVTDTLGALTTLKSGLTTAAKKPVQKPVQKAADKPKPSAADTARSKFFQDSLKKTNFKNAARMAEAPIAPSKFDKAAFEALKTKAGTAPSAPKTTSKRYETPAEAKARVAGLTGNAKQRNNLAGVFGIDSVSNAEARARLDAVRAKEKARNAERAKGSTPLFRVVKADDPARVAKLAAMKKAAEAPGASAWAKGRYKDAVSSGMYAKGGKVKKEKTMKYRSGGSTPPQPSAADRKADAKFRESIKNLKVTPEQAAAIGRGNRSEASTPKPKKYAAGGVTKEMPSSKAMGSMNMAKGGKAKAKPAAKAKGKPFAATKFGAAMMKKSADTKGRAMPKFAKGGSIDGCAVRGKTKAKRVVMACSGGKMGGRK